MEKSLVGIVLEKVLPHRANILQIDPLRVSVIPAVTGITECDVFSIIIFEYLGIPHIRIIVVQSILASDKIAVR